MAGRSRCSSPVRRLLDSALRLPDRVRHAVGRLLQSPRLRLNERQSGYDLVQHFRACIACLGRRVGAMRRLRRAAYRTLRVLAPDRALSASNRKMLLSWSRASRSSCDIGGMAISRAFILQKLPGEITFMNNTPYPNVINFC